MAPPPIPPPAPPSGQSPAPPQSAPPPHVAPVGFLFCKISHPLWFNINIFKWPNTVWFQTDVLKAATRWSYSISYFFSSCWFLACTWRSDPLLTPQLLDLVLESQKALEISQEHGSSSCWRWKKRKTASQDSSKKDLLSSFLSLCFFLKDRSTTTDLTQ